jgi:hypothetical protein
MPRRELFTPEERAAVLAFPAEEAKAAAAPQARRINGPRALTYVKVRFLRSPQYRHLLRGNQGDPSAACLAAAIVVPCQST